MIDAQVRAVALIMFAFVTSIAHADELLFVAKPLTKPKEFTGGIEGPACDAAGNIYAVNFAKQGTIGRVTPDGKGSVFLTLDDGSIGNGIRFARNGDMFIADYTNHNILRVAARSTKPTVFAHNDTMNQPNDLAMAPNGVLYASDPNWKDGTGQLWRIGRDGKITRIAADMGTTNGVEVSPDGKTLFVNESKQRNIWAFTITPKGVQNKRRIKQFPDHGFDGMRCDVDGNLYITRYGKGTVVKMTPKGKILREIDVLGKRPSNICFGGPDGRTAYVTEVEHTRLVQFRVDRPGAAWSENRSPAHAADQTADLHTPRIGVRQENLAPLYSGMWTFVWVKGPEHKYCVLDLLCYEHSGMTFLDHKTLDGGAIELRHRSSDKSPHVLLITTVTPEPGAIELVARPALAQPDSDATLPDTLPRPNLCFRVKRSQQFFGSFPHPFPDFIRRCFIFTEKGMTFLGDTERKRLPRIEDQPDDPRNQPPWVQVYTPLWRSVARQKSKET